MTADEYNRKLMLMKAALWSKVYAMHYQDKVGKRAIVSTAGVHADNAVAEFSKRFVKDLLP